MKGDCMRICRRMLPLLLLAAVFSAAAGAQDMRENTMRSLFADQKAAHVGDAITIMVVETNSAIVNNKLLIFSPCSKVKLFWLELLSKQILSILTVKPLKT